MVGYAAPHQPAIAAIDAQITSLETQLHALRVQRNGLSLASTLPPEVMVRILESAHDYIKPLDPKQAGSSRSWFFASAACRHWRAIALASPGLWANVELWNQAPLPWIELCLSRACDLPLSAHIYIVNKHCNELCYEDEDGHAPCENPCGYGHCNSKVEERCRRHSYDNTLLQKLAAGHYLGRIAQLYIYDRSREEVSSLHALPRNLLAHPELALKYFGSEANDDETLQNLFTFGSARSLRTFTWNLLRPWALDYPPTEALISLTMLELTDASGYIGSDTQPMRRLLQNMPHLEILTIECATYGPPSLEALPLTLPHLREVNLDGDPYFLNDMMSMISTPSDWLRLKTCDGELRDAAREYVAAFWNSIAPGQLLPEGTAADTIRLEKSQNCIQATFAGDCGARGLSYHAKVEGDLSYFRQLPDFDFHGDLIGQVRLVVLDMESNRGEMALVKHYAQAWANVPHLIVARVDWDDYDWKQLWELVQHERFRSVRICGTKDLSEVRLGEAKAVAEKLVQDGVVGEIDWSTERYECHVG